MHMHRNLLRTLLAMACVLPATAARGDVVVDMPAPPKTAEPAEEAETAATADQAEDTAASSAVPAASAAVQPSVGQIALARYAWARRRPHDTYYVSSHSRFAGYYWPSYSPPCSSQPQISRRVHGATSPPGSSPTPSRAICGRSSANWNGAVPKDWAKATPGWRN